MHPKLDAASSPTRVPRITASASFSVNSLSISLSGNEQHTSEFSTKRRSGRPLRMASRKWYRPPAVPRAWYSRRYLIDRLGKFVAASLMKSRNTDSS